MPLASWAPSPTYTNVTYTSTFVTATATERLSIFFPTLPAPAGGYPVLLWFENPGFIGGTIPATIDTAQVLLFEALTRGCVVVYANTCQTKDVAAGGPPGAGTFDPPLTTTPPEQAHWNDPGFPNCMKSACHAVQYLKENSATIGINPDKIFTAGRSGGSAPAMWVALGPNWADTAITPAGQFRAGISTRTAGFIVLQAHAWWSAHKQSGTGAVPQQWAPKQSNPVNQVAGASLGGSDTFSVYQVRFSPLSYGINQTLYPGVQALNATQRGFLYSPGPVFSGLTPAATEADFAFNVSDQPVISDKITAFHDGWHMAILYRRLRQLDPEWWQTNCRLVFQDSSAGGYGETHTAKDDQDAFRMAAEWLVGAAGLEPVAPPVSEQILRELEVRLTNVVKGASYYHTPQAVRRGLAGLMEGPYPAFTIVPQGTEYADRGEMMTDATTGRLRVTIAFMHLGSQGDGSIQQRVLETEADIRKALFADPQLKGLCIDVQHVSTDFAFELDQNSLAGAEMEWEIHYRTPIFDQTTPI
jgi:hypothetical protein